MIPLRVIDVSAAERCAWVDRSDPCCVFVDIRPDVRPDVVADSRSLPFGPGAFDLAVFDPPHTFCNPEHSMGHRYGSWRSIPSLCADTARELARVVADDGLLSFKWNDHSWTLQSAAGWLAPWWQPMFGQFPTARRHSGPSVTAWVMFKKQDAGGAPFKLKSTSRRSRQRALASAPAPIVEPTLL